MASRPPTDLDPSSNMPSSVFESLEAQGSYDGASNHQTSTK